MSPPDSTRAAASVGALVIAASRLHADRVALEVGGRAISYRELLCRSGRIARALQGLVHTDPMLGAIFASRSETAYSAVLGILLSGAGYVPLNPKFPNRRNTHMLEASAASSLIVGRECIEQLPELLRAISRRLLILLPDVANVSEISRHFPAHAFLGSEALAQLEPVTEAPAVDPAAIAYLLFTSGSTGLPKGVMVSHANVLPFVEAMWRRYEITEADRFSQTFDLTFDLSVFDMFVCWSRGASLCCVPNESLMLPDQFIRDHALTVWFSVPSVGMMLRKVRRLTKDAFPTLRWSLFCGERLPSDVAVAWQASASRSIVENLYGPTEATIACTLYRWTDASQAECVDGTVPIGVPYPEMSACIVDDQLVRISDGERGELCVKGPQVTIGYWHDPARTQERFVAMPWYAGTDNRWYRTGDIAYLNATGQLIHCGRNDDQIKLRGFRIELREVEHAVCQAAGTTFAVVLPYPANENGVQGLTAIIADCAVSEETIVDAVKANLPDYMVPSRIVFIAELPLNANGKIDRPALLARLRAEDT